MSDLTKRDWLEELTRKDWFILFLAILPFLIPPYASNGYIFPGKWHEVTFYALFRGIVYFVPTVYPIFKVIPILLVTALVIFGNRVRRIFNIYVALSFLTFALGQNIGTYEKYGIAICIFNLIFFLIIAAFWISEVFVSKNDFTPRRQLLWRYWVVPVAIFAFWFPSHAKTLTPYFNPAYIINSMSGMTFSSMAPVYIALLTLYYPHVNVAVLRIMSIVGMIIGIYYSLINFLYRPELLWWNGVMHIPLLALSLYGLIISNKREDKNFNRLF